MRKALKSLIVTFALAGLSLPVLAQSTPQEQSDQQGQAHHRRWNGQMPSVDERVAHMTKTLNLNADQQSKIKSILEDQQKQMTSLKDDTSMSQQDKHAKFRQIHQDTQEKISSVLTDQQKAQWEKMHAEHKQHMEKQGAGSSEKQ